MCGFVGFIDENDQTYDHRAAIVAMTDAIAHRGPDSEGYFEDGRAALGFRRLAIIDLAGANQPLYNENRSLVLVFNGEIYNYRELRRQLIAAGHAFSTQGDAEVVLHGFERWGAGVLDRLRGMFAFALYDSEKDAYLIGRDHLGIIPLYMGYDEHGQLYVASEMKALVPVCRTIKEFPAGSYLWSKDGEIRQYYQRDWFDYDAVKDNVTDKNELRQALEESVKSHLMSDVPYGVLLSGGLDSSVISAITKKFAARRVEDQERSEAWWPQLHSFAVGLEGSPDLKAAQEVANHLGTVHHEIHFTVQEGLDAIRDVIYHIETYDVTTIRASTPMYLMSRKIKAMGIKMVLSGEGSDEVFGGYLYFHKAPTPQAFHEETVRKLSKLYLYDCLRANKSLAAWGVEGRVPFLDKEFLDVAMRLNPATKMCPGKEIEKKVVREAFADMLPESVAWRQKEQFSDGVGYSWIDTLKAVTAAAVSDEQMRKASERFPVNTPMNKEEYYYRTIFEEHFPSESAARSVPSVPSVACSTAEALAWDVSFQGKNDPSGRAVAGVHEEAYKD